MLAEAVHARQVIGDDSDCAHQLGLGRAVEQHLRWGVPMQSPKHRCYFSPSTQSRPINSVRLRATMLSSRFLAPRVNHPWPDALIRPLEWPPFVPACCCITRDFLADSRLPVHFAPATVTLNASCSPAACTSSVSPCLMLPRRNSSASGSSRYFSTARRIGRAP